MRQVQLPDDPALEGLDSILEAEKDLAEQPSPSYITGATTSTTTTPAQPSGVLLIQSQQPSAAQTTGSGGKSAVTSSAASALQVAIASGNTTQQQQQLLQNRLQGRSTGHVMQPTHVTIPRGAVQASLPSPQM